MHPQAPSTPKQTRSACRFVLAFSAVTTITALFSILVLAFKADGSITYRSVTYDGEIDVYGRVGSDSEIRAPDLTLYPLYLYLGLVKPTLAGAGISLALALGMGLLCLFVRRRGKALLVSCYSQNL